MNWLEHDKEKLKPCPFCGGENVRTVTDNEYQVYFGVKCFDCGGCIDAEKEKAEEAVNAWNKRNDIDRVLEIIEELKAMEDGLETRANSIGFVNHTPTGDVKDVEHLVMPRNPIEIKVVKLNAKADGIQYAREYLKQAVLALKGNKK